MSRNATFTLPIHILFFRSRGLSLAEIGTIEAIFTVTILFAESPTGYVGDRIGRRNSLLVGTALTAFGAVAFTFSTTFWMFVGVIVLRSIAHTFHSGAESAWLYDTLIEKADEEEYARISGRAEGFGKLMGGLAAILGASLYSIDKTFPFLVEGVLVGSGFFVLLTVNESDPKEEDDESLSPGHAIRIVRETLSKRELSSFVLYTALLVGIINTIDIFVQPITTETLAIDPELLGGLYAVFLLVSAGVSSQAGVIKERFGITGWFVSMPILLGITMVAVAVFPPIALLVFLLARTILTGSGPLLHQYINDHSGSLGRATVLSAASMVRTFFVAPLNVIGGTLASMLLLDTALAALGTVLLFGSATILLWQFPVVDPVSEPAS